MQTFCAEIPLYAKFSLQEVDRDKVFCFISNQVNVDLFCVECAMPSVFLGMKIDLQMQYYNFDFRDRIFTKDFICSRVHSHKAYFHFKIFQGGISKIGQWPSMVDLEEAGLHRYRKVLDASDYRELARAVGLTSHGVGIGSFVYLRRIFERLIGEAREVQCKRSGWDEEAYQRGRMDEKIQILHDVLPPFLVEQRGLYGILSKGIHELSEEECLESYPVVQAGIELILDQKVALREQADKIAAAKKQISILQSKMKKD